MDATPEPPPQLPAPPDSPDAGIRPLAFLARACEFAALYATIPLLMLFYPAGGMLIPGLVAGGVACVLLLRRDQGFDRRRFWNFAAARREVPSIMRTFAVSAVLITTAVWLMDRGNLLHLPRHKPGLWAVIMVAYPVFSVYPQEIIYRAFLMHRYRPLFPGKYMMILGSSAAFGFGHIMFINPAIAVGLTLAGGALFAWRYQRSGSLLAAAIEHALYGCLIFTVGLGEYFYLGATLR